MASFSVSPIVVLVSSFWNWCTKWWQTLLSKRRYF